MKAFINTNSPITILDRIKDNLNWDAPINNIATKIKLFLSNFFSLKNIYKAAAVKSWGNKSGFGPEIKNSGAAITGKFRSL